MSATFSLFANKLCGVFWTNITEITFALAYGHNLSTWALNIEQPSFIAVFRKGLQRGLKARNSSAPKSTPNKLKSLKVAHIKDEMDVDEDEDGV